MYKYLALLGLGLSLLLAACAGDTPKQQAYDVIGKAKAVLIVARDVAQHPDTPDDVKAHIKLASQAITTSVGAYVEAVKSNGSTAAYLQEAVSAVSSLVTYLVTNGYMKAAQAPFVDPVDGRTLQWA